MPADVGDIKEWGIQIPVSLEESFGLAGTTSLGGKGILIKSVAQAIPTFSISCFKLSRGLCEHINAMLRKF
jgi:hypothetical protein